MGGSLRSPLGRKRLALRARSGWVSNNPKREALLVRKMTLFVAPKVRPLIPFSHRRCELQFENCEFAHRGTRKFVCLSGAQRPQFFRYGHEILDLGPPRPSAKMLFGIFEKIFFFNFKKIKNLKNSPKIGPIWDRGCNFQHFFMKIAQNVYFMNISKVLFLF